MSECWNAGYEIDLSAVFSRFFQYPGRRRFLQLFVVFYGSGAHARVSTGIWCRASVVHRWPLSTFTLLPMTTTTIWKCYRLLSSRVKGLLIVPHI